jgi:hypothetical protein
MRQQKLQPHSKTDEFSMQPHALNNFFIQAAHTRPIKRRRFAAGFCTGTLQPAAAAAAAAAAQAGV